MASGLILVLINRATKLFKEFLNLPKEYLATIRFGVETDTWDLDGTTIRQVEVEEIDINSIKKILDKFMGKIKQVPPMYSAIKYNGKQLYKLARKGINIRRNPRDAEFYKLDLIDLKKDILNIRVVCSSGAYIRSLANDIGKLYGTGAVLVKLVRTRIGDFDLSSSINLKDFLKNVRSFGRIKESSYLLSLEKIFEKNPVVYTKREYDKRIINGSPIELKMIDRSKTSPEYLFNILSGGYQSINKLVLIKNSMEKILAIHELVEEVIQKDIESFDSNFTKSIVIF